MLFLWGLIQSPWVLEIDLGQRSSICRLHLSISSALSSDVPRSDKPFLNNLSNIAPTGLPSLFLALISLWHIVFLFAYDLSSSTWMAVPWKEGCCFVQRNSRTSCNAWQQRHLVKMSSKWMSDPVHHCWWAPKTIHSPRHWGEKKKKTRTWTCLQTQPLPPV